MTDTAREQVAPQTIQVTVDGKAVAAAPGELVIEVAERAGVYIPRFCYHPRMEPVGMCRMCLVEVSGPRGFSLQPACYLRVADGQEVRTSSPKATKAQEGVLEFLLVNHPLDCPVCDKGGECPLQDQALSHGPGESRFVEEKRHWEKPIEIGPLVHLDRERCIQCARCTRFAAEVAGEALIDFAFRGAHIEVAPFPERPFSSYFSGNTVQICPVGALTAAPYRFRSRPWDLEQVETTCTTCSVGCRVAAQSAAGRLVRYLGIDSEPVNQSWLCDKGRFGYEAAHATNRITRPLVRRAGELVEVRWAEALREVAAGVRQSDQRFGPGGIAVLGGARLTNEDAYAWSKLAKSILRTDHVDAELGDGLPAELVLGLPRATIDDAVNAKAVIVLAPDLREELPVLYLRLRNAAATVPVIECSAVPTALSKVARVRCGYLPGEAQRLAGTLVGDGPIEEIPGTDAAEIERARAVLSALASEGTASARGDGVVIVLGRPSLAEDGRSIAGAAALLQRALPGARFLSALRRANVHGALDMGLAPGVLPGRVGLEAGRQWFEAAWGELPSDRGRDARGILEAAGSGELSMLILLGADPIADFPDAVLARHALEQVDLLVAVATHRDASNELAHVVLPVAGADERFGATTNLEGRVTRLAPKVVPPGVAWPAWSVASELARTLGSDLGFSSIETLSREISRLAPAHRGIDLDSLSAPERRDGIMAPLAETPVTLLGRRSVAPPRPIDPIATPGIFSVEEQGAPLGSGAAIPVGGHGLRPSSPSSARPPLLALGGLEALGLGGGAPGRLDAYSFRLVLRRALYDHGTLVQASPSLGRLAGEAVLTANPHVLEQLGVRPGDQVRCKSARAAIEVPIEADASLSRSVVVLTANLKDGANALVDTGSPVTDVRLETLQ